MGRGRNTTQHVAVGNFATLGGPSARARNGRDIDAEVQAERRAARARHGTLAEQLAEDAPGAFAHACQAYASHVAAGGDAGPDSPAAAALAELEAALAGYACRDRAAEAQEWSQQAHKALGLTPPTSGARPVVAAATAVHAAQMMRGSMVRIISDPELTEDNAREAARRAHALMLVEHLEQSASRQTVEYLREETRTGESPNDYARMSGALSGWVVESVSGMSSFSAGLGGLRWRDTADFSSSRLVELMDRQAGPRPGRP